MKAAAFLLVISCLPICSGSAHAESRVLTVHECIAECLSRNPGIAARQLTLAADKENIWKARSGLLPDLTGSASLGLYDGSPTGPWALMGVNDVEETGTPIVNERKPSQHVFRVSWGTVGAGSLKLDYPLYANGSIFGLNNAPVVATAKARYQAQTLNIRLTEQDLIANLVSTFYDTVAYERKTDLDTREVELAKKRVEIVEEELRQNLILPQYLEVAKEQLEAKKQSLKTSEQWAADSERMLAELLGRSPKQKLNLNKADPHIPEVPPLETFLDKVSSDHPAVAIQTTNIEIAQQQYRLAQTALFPSVNFSTSYGGGTAFGPRPLDQFFAGVGVDVPIFDFGHNLAAEHENLDLLKSAQAQLDEVRLELRQSILGELDKIHTIESTLADLERAYVIAKTNLDLVASQHDQGISTQLALVDANTALAEAEENLLLYRLTWWIQYAQLQRLSGGLWVWNK
jgi:outer membrane protein